MAGEFWLSDQQWASIEPHLPRNRPGARRVDDRRVLSGIIHVLKSGCRWQDCPAVYGPPTTIYSRFHRWSARGLWQRLFQALVAVTPDDVQMIDSTSAKAHRSADEPRKSTLSSMAADDPSPSKYRRGNLGMSERRRLSWHHCHRGGYVPPIPPMTATGCVNFWWSAAPCR